MTVSNSGKASAWPRRQPPRQPQQGAAGPAGWFQPTGGEAAPPFRHGMESARSDKTDEIDQTDETPGFAGDDYWYQDPTPTAAHQVPELWPWSPQEAPQQIPMVDPQGRSGWQLAQQVWQESGVSWEPAWAGAAESGPVGDWDEPAEDWDDPADDEWGEPAGDGAEQVPQPWETSQARRDGAGWSDYPAGGFPGQSWLMDGTGPMPIQSPSRGVPLAFTTMPLGAPVAAEPRVTRSLGESDELFRAWQGSVREAAAPRRQWSALWQGTTSGNRRARRAVTIGVPAAVLVTVGAGALLMLTGKANGILAVGAGNATQPPGSQASQSISGSGQAGTRVTGVTLAGYPGQQGAIAADSMWSAEGIGLAVGEADGHPAIWRRDGGTWTLESAATTAAGPGTGNLTAVAHGPDGWIAVGSTVTGSSKAPLVLASADGVTWQPVAALINAAGPDVQFLGVAAGPGGYAVVGRQLTGRRMFAAIWWSANLHAWVQDGNGGLDGRLTTSIANAAASAGNGCVAVGSHGSLAAIWTTHGGGHWDVRDIPAVAGARSATLRQVAASGNTIVATGYATSGAGDIPIAVTSTDGGARWRLLTLPTTDGHGTVTALTADGGAFVVTGLVRAGRPVTWSSQDGLNWSAATPVNGVLQITALSGADGRVTGTGTVRQGANPAIVTVAAP